MEIKKLKNNSHALSTIEDCRIVSLERFGNLEGTFSVVENGGSSPLGYDVRRVYYLFDLPAGTSRGGHSHFSLIGGIVAVAGSFDITVSDGVSQRTFTLKHPWECLIIPTGIWRTLENFSSGAVCMVLASEEFEEDDYVRSYEDFLALTASKRQ